MRLKFLIFFAVITTSLWAFGAAKTQGQSLAISPAFVDAKVKRGATYNKAYSVANNTGARLRFRFSVGDYWYDENNGRVEGRPGTLPRSASLWVQFSPAEVVIEPRSSITVNVIITVPLTAEGGYYTTPIFEAEADDTSAVAALPKGALNASIALRFCGLLMLTTEDATEYNVEIMNGHVTPPSASAPLEMQLDVRNRSTAHARVRGVFAILNSVAGLAGSSKIEEKRYLPGQRDVLKTAWAGDLPAGHYTALVTLTYDRAGMEPATLVYELPFDVK
jgi:hypothetical protein